MSWNYRVIEHNNREESYCQIHEVYYGENGNIIGCSENGSVVGSDNRLELDKVLDMMKEALRKPMLSFSEFNKNSIVYKK